MMEITDGPEPAFETKERTGPPPLQCKARCSDVDRFEFDDDYLYIVPENDYGDLEDDGRKICERKDAHVVPLLNWLAAGINMDIQLIPKQPLRT